MTLKIKKKSLLKRVVDDILIVFGITGIVSLGFAYNNACGLQTLAAIIITAGLAYSIGKINQEGLK